MTHEALTSYKQETEYKIFAQGYQCLFQLWPNRKLGNVASSREWSHESHQVVWFPILSLLLLLLNLLLLFHLCPQ